MMHELKLRVEYADAVYRGQKSFEIRKDDRGYQKGDTVRFKVIDGNGNHIDHPVEGQEYLIDYVLHGWGLEQNWCAFAIKNNWRERIKAAAGATTISDPAEFHSPMPETIRRMTYRKMPVELGQEVTLVWYNADRETWRTEDQPVTGVCFEGFRLSSHPVISPLDSTDLFGWDELNKEVFLTRDLAMEEADRRNREGIRP